MKLRAAVTAVAALLVYAPAATAAPNTSIGSGPSGLHASRSATFRFSANVPRAKYQCKLDRRAWSRCRSPRKYAGLAQGVHRFRVRAGRNRSFDRSPATRAFTVDTLGPDTAITSGPQGTITDHEPSFGFSSPETGVAFECRLGAGAFGACTSPFGFPVALPDGFYRFEVRARDRAGNADPTPAARAFNPETPLTMTPETAAIAAAMYFPDAVDFDVPASCGSPSLDCPGGTPLAPADQLRMASTRSLVEVAGAARYDLTAVSDVQTLQVLKVGVPLVGDCDLTMTSANGTSPTWRSVMSLNFVSSATTGALRIVPGSLSITGMETDDFLLTGSLGCQFASLGLGFFIGTLQDALATSVLGVTRSLCAAPGPAYLGPCPD